MGPCAGGAVYSPAITDFVFMVEGSSYMFITGPDVVKTVTGEEVTFEELGGAATHASRSGVAHFVAPDEQSCLDDARYLLSFLPQNNLDPPPFAEPTDPRDRESPELDTFIPDHPNKPYDMTQVIAAVVDDGEFLQVHERYAENNPAHFRDHKVFRSGGGWRVIGSAPNDTKTSSLHQCAQFTIHFRKHIGRTGFSALQIYVQHCVRGDGGVRQGGKGAH